MAFTNVAVCATLSLLAAHTVGAIPAPTPSLARESNGRATVHQDPVAQIDKTLREIPYDRHIHIGDPDMFLLRHPCDYKRCNHPGKTCIVRPGYRTTSHALTCKPHCLSLARALGRPHTTRECIYQPHPEIDGVETLTCNCRTNCGEHPAAEAVCGSDGQTYASFCHLQRHNCLEKTEILALHLGPCEDSTEMVQRRQCQPDLTISSIHTESPIQRPPVQYYYGFLELHCTSLACPGVEVPTWYKQNFTNGVLSEPIKFIPDRSRTIEHSRPGQSYMAIFPTKQEDSGLYTCEIRSGDQVFSRSQNVIVKEPANESMRQVCRNEYNAMFRAYSQ